MSLVKRGIKEALEWVPTTPDEIVREYAVCQQLEKDTEARKARLKPKLNMIIPVDLDAKAFTLAEFPGLRFVARRIRQDRRKIDDDMLMVELDKLVPPPDAFVVVRRPDHKKVAALIEAGDMSEADLTRCMTGKKLEYVSLTSEKESDPLRP